MKKNGFTILELLVSIIILSIVLIFAMNLFLKVRSAYTNEKTNIEMEITKSAIIDTVMSDLDESAFANMNDLDGKIVNSISCAQNKVTMQLSLNETGHNKRILEFDTSSSSNDYIKYYDTGALNAGYVRKLPKGSLKGPLSCTTISNITVGTLNHITYPIEDENKNDYSIDMFIVSAS